mmetsp:Transcript_65388/g.181403  ORF Transcript_65388/g.181403 Transcript_65388/m.181403 type:complete len:521 (+) Transcript_65388:48-1610(+)
MAVADSRQLAPARITVTSMGGDILADWHDVAPDCTILELQHRLEIQEAHKGGLAVQVTLIQGSRTLRREQTVGALLLPEAATLHAVLVVAPGADHVALLHSPDRAIRLRALRALTSLGASAVPHAPKLVALLSDSVSTVRRAAAHALRKLSRSGAPVAERLVLEAPGFAELLRHTDASVRCLAAKTLASLGPAAAPHAAELAAMRRDPDREIRRSAAKALAGMRREGRCAVQEELAALLDDPDQRVRHRAVRGFVGMGAAAGTHAAALAALLKDADSGVRGGAAKALANIGAAAAPFTLQLVPLLRDPSGTVRRRSAKTLGRLGASAAPHIKELAQMLLDPCEDVAHWAAYALQGIAKFDAGAVPHFVALLQDPDTRIRYAAARACRRIGKWANFHLWRLFHSGDWRARHLAVDAFAWTYIPVNMNVPTSIERLIAMLVSFRALRPRTSRVQVATQALIETPCSTGLLSVIGSLVGQHPALGTEVEGLAHLLEAPVLGADAGRPGLSAGWTGSRLRLGPA